jgi:hypothetical protein
MAGYVRSYRPGDERQLATCLRKADRMEIEAASGARPVDVLRWSAERSAPACSIIYEDRVVGMFGCVPDGTVWLLGADALVQPPLVRQFLRECRRYVDALPYPLLHNLVDERNTVHIRWLQWMGFTFIGEPVLLGPHQLPFRKFVRIQPYVHGSTGRRSR